MCTLDPRQFCAWPRRVRRVTYPTPPLRRALLGRCLRPAYAFRRARLVLRGDGSKPVEDVTASRSKVGGPFEIVGVAGALDGDRRSGVLDLVEVAGRQLEVGSGDVLFETVQFAGPGYGHYPRLLREQPRQCDLPGGGAL